MELRLSGRKLSFDVLTASDYDDAVSAERLSTWPRSKSDEDLGSFPNRKRKKKRNKKGKDLQDASLISENAISDKLVINGDLSYSCTTTTVAESAVVPDADDRDNCAVRTVIKPSLLGELRQRNVGNVMNGGSMDFGREGISSKKKDEKVMEDVVENRAASIELSSDQLVELNGQKLETEVSLDWQKLMAEDLNFALPVERSPIKCFLEELNAGNSLRSTTTLGNDTERERVYDTIFRLPWRCELVINFGLFVCFDSFLSLLTVMPTRIIMTLWRILKTRQFKRLSSAELSDFGCLIVLVSGVTLLQQADISLIYHMIRGQAIFKLYVVYNILEIFDKLCQSFGGDVMQALFNSADGLANSPPENVRFWLLRFISDEVLAVGSSIIHSFILLAQAITLSTCIVAHNNALFAMLVSNNFAEIKSNVFKRYSKENVQNLVYFDSVERFHISAFVLFVLAQNILEAEGPWFESFLCNVLVVYIFEVMIDIIKHSFIAKFNEIKPIAFSEFLEDLCKQTLNIQTENMKRNLTFVPLAPACVVIRVSRPVYAALLPCHPLPWRILWILILCTMTFVMLTSLKMLIGMGLQQQARWYVKRCERRKLHSD